METVREKGMTQEIEDIVQYMKSVHLSDSIPSMEQSLEKVIGYGQRIGELVNLAEHNYSTVRAESLSRLQTMDEETEVMRKTKLDAWVANDRKLLMDLKNIAHHLRAQRMALQQTIKTRRDER